MHKLHYPQSAKEPATLKKWLANVGQDITPDAPVALLETRDALVELSTSQPGRLAEQLTPERTTIAPGTEIARIQTGSITETKTETTENKVMTDAKPATDKVTPLLLPQAGNSMEEGTILEWKVAEGDTIEQGQIIYELETDKATIEVEADHGGRLSKIVAPADTIVAVKEPVAYLADDDADVEAFLAQSGDTTEATPETPASPVAAPTAEVTPLLLPQAGNSMEEGTILEWKVAEGDTIEQGQIIYELETDKATIEVEADHGGRLAKIVAPADTIVAVKEPVAYLSDDDASVETYIQQNTSGDSETPAATESAPAAAPVKREAAPAVVDERGRVKASPAARKLAAERGIDLHSVATGSGPNGRILSTDLDAALPAVTDVTRKKLAGMRKAIAKNLTASKQNIPHFYMTQTIDAAPMMAYYRARKPETGCSLNDVLLHNLGICLREFPDFRTRLEGEELVTYPTANIGIAVGMDDGLVVPVAIGADRMSLQNLSDETTRLIDAARSGKIENMGQGVMTVSNLGMFGIQDFSAIINPPEASILAVSAIREEVIVKDGAMRPGRVMTMTLSADHRVIDGLLAARFMARLKELLEGLE